MNRIVTLLQAFLILGLILLLSCTDNVPKQETCHLTGKVVGRNSTAMELINATSGEYHIQSVTIPIDSNGVFNYDLKYKIMEAYEMAFEDELNSGAWRPVLFFPDADTIKFTLYPMKLADSNKIEGGRLSQEKSEMFNHIKNQYYVAYMTLQTRLDSLKKCNNCNPGLLTTCQRKLDSIESRALYYKLQFAKLKGDIYGFYQLLDIIRYDKDRRFYSLDTLEKYSLFFQEKFPNHPYVEILKYRFNALSNIKVGGRFVPFSAPDSTGKIWHVSDFVLKNKLTLIDLWAPWCAPCIRKSKKMIPVYEQYKDSGFSIFAVVGGINDKSSFLQSIRKFHYPWLLTSDVNDENKIWEKYGIPNAGGEEFLVDKNGIIVAINPSPIEIIEKLAKISD